MKAVKLSDEANIPKTSWTTTSASKRKVWESWPWGLGLWLVGLRENAAALGSWPAEIRLEHFYIHPGGDTAGELLLDMLPCQRVTAEGWSLRDLDLGI